MERRVGPITLVLLYEDRGVYVEVTYELADGEVWQGLASFPWEMEEEAARWVDRIQSENDIEDLLREWAPAETWASFQFFRHVIGT